MKVVFPGAILIKARDYNKDGKNTVYAEITTKNDGDYKVGFPNVKKVQIDETGAMDQRHNIVADVEGNIYNESQTLQLRMNN
jgi:hypothetical protein